MRRIAIINQKGGVGKTTTAVNLAAALAECGQRVCVLDLDPQAHATTHLGIEPDGKSPSMYDVLVHSRPLAEAFTCHLPVGSTEFGGTDGAHRRNPPHGLFRIQQ